jgi:hypothetical protein
MKVQDLLTTISTKLSQLL